MTPQVALQECLRFSETPSVSGAKGAIKVLYALNGSMDHELEF